MSDVPPLRFPEFSGEWEKRTLEDVSEFSKERMNTQNLSSDNYVATENMLHDYQGIIEASSVPTNTNVIKFNKGDVLLSNIRPYLKKVWFADKNGGCSADVFVFKALSACIPDFLHYIIANDRFINFAMSGAKGVKMPRGDKEQMKTYEIGLPSIEEQKKIAKLLSLLDERITTQNKIIDKLQSLIKGIAQNVVRSSKPNVQLSECLECNSSTLQESDVYENGTYPVYGANGIVGYLDNYNTEDEAVYIIKDGSGVGTVSYVIGKCSATGTLNILQAKNGYSLQYLYYILKVFNFEPYKTGMAIPHIYFKDYGKAKIFCPLYTEQLKYAMLLSAIDNKLLAEQETLTNLSLQKQYLLHQMFI
jgi:type I restriction enzyme S subunit